MLPMISALPRRWLEPFSLGELFNAGQSFELSSGLAIAYGFLAQGVIAPHETQHVMGAACRDKGDVFASQSRCRRPCKCRRMFVDSDQPGETTSIALES